ncbi:unnamed protein product [Rotaria sordida]|uniref:Uncharacterized protein n=1 Tax=Rotaria sordida TaxID=392033 RepID=A0A814RW00_9BILA|nr:unnamed protein product [Rotaria sordida]
MTDSRCHRPRSQQQKSRTLAEALDLQQNESSDNFQRKRNAKLCDRHTIAYDLTSNSSTATNQTDELPDSFFELTPDDLRSILNTLRQQSAEDNPLETRTMRGRVQSARANTYEYIAIRLVINSNTILQGLFYPEEPLSNLIEFASILMNANTNLDITILRSTSSIS